MGAGCSLGVTGQSSTCLAGGAWRRVGARRLGPGTLQLRSHTVLPPDARGRPGYESGRKQHRWCRMFQAAGKLEEGPVRRTGPAGGVQLLAGLLHQRLIIT